MKHNEFELNLIKGDFLKAEEYIQSIKSPFDKSILKSKLLEKQGKFTQSLDVLSTVASKNLEEEYELLIRILYGNWRIKKYSKCLEIIDNSIPSLESEPLLMGRLYNIIGLIYWSLGKDSSDKQLLLEAKKYHEKAVEFRKLLDTNLELSFSYNNLGNTYLSLNDISKAVFNFEKALEIREKYHMTTEIATSLRDLGRLHLQNNNYNSALNYFNDALKIRIKLGNTYDIAKCNLSIAETYFFLNELEKANEYFQIAKDVFTEIGNPSDLELLDQIKARLNNQI
jgi:tetratricopeptide (TPR) repeat protein